MKTVIPIGIGVLAIAGIIIFATSNKSNSTTNSDSLPESAAMEKNLAVQELKMANENPSQKPMGNVVETAIAAGNFNTLVAAVKAAGLVETLSGPGPFTVFAPTDEAFAKLPPDTIESLLQDKAKLASILTYHVVAGKVMAKDVMGLTSAKTVQGGMLTIDSSSGVKINNAMVTAADIETSNGVIHVIDTVMLPN